MLVVLLLFGSIFCTSVSPEPHCSKFHYEEKMLEKMIRMEIRMEEIEKKLKTCEDKESKMNTKLEQVLDRKHSEPKSKQIVAFSAKVGKSIVGPLASDQPFIFESVDTNIGNAYNNKTGQFVAPVSGTYVFYISILSKRGDAFDASVSVNGSIKARLYEGGIASNYGSASQAVVVQLNSNDVVTVNSQTDGEYAHGGMYSTFSGFLLQSQV